MEKELYKNIPPAERAEMLEANCLRKERDKIKKWFTPEELSQMKDEFSVFSIKKAEKEDEKADLTAAINADLKKHKEVINNLLKKLKDKHEEVEAQLFAFDDQEEGTMNYFDLNGDLVYSRKLLPNERQSRIINLNKTA